MAGPARESRRKSAPGGFFRRQHRGNGGGQGPVLRVAFCPVGQSAEQTVRAAHGLGAQAHIVQHPVKVAVGHGRRCGTLVISSCRKVALPHG